MLLAIKIGVFYGAPVMAVVISMLSFVLLLRRVRRGELARVRAAWLHAGTLLLPFLAVALVWATSEITGCIAAGAGRCRWDGAAALELLIDLMPLAGYAGVPVAALAVGFWTTLAAGARRRPPGR